MQLNNALTQAQSFFETVGCLRFPNTCSSHRKLAQKVARSVITIFVLLSFVNFYIQFLPCSMRLIVNGSLIILISSLGVSVLCKGLQYLLNFSLKNKQMTLDEKKIVTTTNFSSSQTDDNFNHEVLSPTSSHYFKTGEQRNLSNVDGKQITANRRAELVKVKRNLLSDFEKP